MSLLLHYWQKVPDLRFGQFLENVRLDKDLGRDLFYVEDRALLMAAEQWIAERVANGLDKRRTETQK